MRPNYNSTKLCFAYFGFYPRSNPGKRKAWFILYRVLPSAASLNLLQACGAFVI
jgi:hypothetical protein